MNVYQVTGIYRLWGSSSIPETDFSKPVLAQSVEEAIEIAHAEYRDAVVHSVELIKNGVLVKKASNDHRQP